MGKLKTNIIIDILMLVSFAVMSVTGYLMEIMPTCSSGRGHGAPILGLGRHDWGDVHLIAAICVMVFLILHIVLHWPMVDGFFKKHIPNKGMRTSLYMVLFLLLIFSVVPWIWAF